MRSLNDLVRDVIESKGSRVKVREILLDPSLPSIYDRIANDLFLLLDNMFDEINQHNGRPDVEVMTVLEGDEQILLVSWRGQISDEKIAGANLSYREGALLAELEFPGTVSGSKYMGLSAERYGGSVKLERCDGDSLGVQNELRLPVTRN